VAGNAETACPPQHGPLRLVEALKNAAEAGEIGEPVPLRDIERERLAAVNRRKRSRQTNEERERRKAGGYRCRWPVWRSFPYGTLTLSDTAILRLRDETESVVSGSKQ
jgi:hypothetical protein